jgi:uncharacterized membrane protein
MVGKLWVHAITLSICVVALVFTFSFFSSQPLLPEPVFIAILAVAVAMVIVSMCVWMKEKLEESIQEMEERLTDSISPRHR